eukprot:2745728-Pleurochrysis_carterae.AAC.2
MKYVRARELGVNARVHGGLCQEVPACHGMCAPMGVCASVLRVQDRKKLGRSEETTKEKARTKGDGLAR